MTQDDFKEIQLLWNQANTIYRQRAKNYLGSIAVGAHAREWGVSKATRVAAIMHPYAIVKNKFQLTPEQLLPIRQAFKTGLELVLDREVLLPDFTHLAARMKTHGATYDKVSRRHVGKNKGKAKGRAIGKWDRTRQTKEQKQRQAEKKAQDFACPNCLKRICRNGGKSILFRQHISMPANKECLEAAARSTELDASAQRVRLWAHHLVLHRRGNKNSFQGQWLQKTQHGSGRNFDFKFSLMDADCSDSACICRKS